MRSLCELLHLTALDSREGEIAIHALIVFIDDAGIETAVGKHVGYDLVVGCTLIGNLCRRTDDVVSHVAQLVENLQAHEVTAVGHDELQVGHAL